MPTSIRPGDVLAGRYRLEDLLSESEGGRFWRAHDAVLDRHVAVHVISADDPRADALLAAARASATVQDRCVLRVLDADQHDGLCYVVNEWGAGISLDVMLAGDGPLEPRQAAWLAAEVGASLAAAHQAGVAHGRLVPENVLLDHNGHVRLIGLAVDAALHGLPPGRRSTDVADLAGVLYAALTGRWAGITASAVPRALVDNGEVLRPRRVRAGIPRPLDQLCEEVLNPETVGTHAKAAYDLTTARGITDYLRAFVGDPTGLAPATGGAVRAHGADARPTAYTAAYDEPAAYQPAVPDPPPEAAVPEPVTEQPTVAVAGPLPAEEQPTELGMPIFDDDSDDVGWLTARATVPPPPPPFEQPPERPLFAPDPPPGEPARRSRPGAAVAGQPPWPPDTGTGTGTGSGTGTGTGARPRTGTGSGTGWGRLTTGSGPLILEEVEDDHVPGRRTLRLAAAILAAILLLLAALVAINLGRGRSPLDLRPGSSSTPTPTASTSQSPEPTVLAGLTATDLDPQGNPREENPDLAPLAVDGDPGTSWHTMTYKQDFGPGGLKTGVGLVVDLGEARAVRDVTLRLGGGATTVSLFLTETPPSAVAGLTPAATGTADPTLRAVLDGAEGRYLTVWLTSLPRTADGFRGQVAEVEVRG